MLQSATYFVTGLLFAVGLVVGGMTQPQKIIGFLDIFGDWDPSLALVMLGAVGVHSLSYRLIMRRAKPLMATSFLVPKRSDIDASLLIGTSLFGIGWGLGGFCPGPALVASGALVPDAIVFVGFTLVGHWLFGRYSEWAQRRSTRNGEQQAGTTPMQAT